MTEGARGVAAMFGACALWGFSPILYKALDHVPPLEVVVHRSLWSLIFFAAVLAVQGRLGLVRRALARPRDAAVIALAALVISANWWVFTGAIQWERATEASLGYFTFPLTSVLVGVVVYGERLGRAQSFAVILAGAALVVLAFGLGAAPWIALMLALTLVFYGVVKKSLSVGPVVSVTAEVLLLLPIVLFLLWQMHSTGGGHFGRGLHDSLLLALSGPLTATPLVLFSYAAKRLRMATLGLLQYINPTLQLLVATLIFGEVFTRWHAVAFPLIWLALAIYTVALWRQERAARRLARSSVTVVHTVT
ncbi:MAG: EamA family transporter RarD [Roseovarius sp.]|nr:EamA family transporter RarD [Roseovarius sp.]